MGERATGRDECREELYKGEKGPHGETITGKSIHRGERATWRDKYREE
jgi:hypothetical protein